MSDRDARLRAMKETWIAAHDDGRASAWPDILAAADAVDPLRLALRELHKPYGDGEPDDDCAHDGFYWPCPTARLLDGDTDE
jgi:hypothetical protein